MHRSIFAIAAAIAVLAVHAATAHAVDPDVKCESGKLKVSGKYASCRLDAESKAVKLAIPADVTKCEAKFVAKYTGLEIKAGPGVCPTEGDEPDVNGDVKKAVADLKSRVKYSGFRGKVKLDTPAGEYWLEDDGVEPEVAGCHTAWVDEDCEVTPVVGPGSVIGEACVTFGAETLLLETNPDAFECHAHHKEKVLVGAVVVEEDYSGHPYLYDCDEFCDGLYGVTGACTPEPLACGGAGSARCACATTTTTMP